MPTRSCSRRRGNPQSRRNALRAVHTAGEAAGLNGDGRERVGLHDLRHSFVALALAAGLSLAEAAALARHANARVTAQVYAGLADDGREARRGEAGPGGLRRVTAGMSRVGIAVSHAKKTVRALEAPVTNAPHGGARSSPRAVVSPTIRARSAPAAT